MSDMAAIERRLERIEGLLQQLLSNGLVDPHHGLPKSTIDLKTEIAMVKAADGDLIAHFKEKGRRQVAASRRTKR